MINTTKSPGFWDTAKGLLRVTSAAEIGDPTYRGLQTVIDTVLKRDLNKIPSADSTEPAPLAVGRESSRSTLHFNKFSVPGPLLGLCEKQRKLAMAGTGSPLELMVNCTVTNMQKGDDDYVRILETNQGVLSWMDEKTKIILCAGVSYPKAWHVGQKQGYPLILTAYTCRLSPMPHFFSTLSKSAAALWASG